MIALRIFEKKIAVSEKSQMSRQNSHSFLNTVVKLESTFSSTLQPVFVLYQAPEVVRSLWFQAQNLGLFYFSRLGPPSP